MTDVVIVLLGLLALSIGVIAWWLLELFAENDWEDEPK